MHKEVNILKKYWQAKLNNTFKAAHITVNWDLFHGCENDLTFTS